MRLFIIRMVAAALVICAAEDAERDEFIGGAIRKMKDALQGSSNAGEKEGCFMCEIVVRRIEAIVGPPRPTLTIDDWDVALEEVCSRMPPMGFQACETLKDKNQESAAAYIAKVSLGDICAKVAQLCWFGLLV